MEVGSVCSLHSQTVGHGLPSLWNAGGACGAETQKSMIEPKHPKVSLARQCKLLKFNRSSYYYRPRPVSPKNLELMAQINEQYLETPCYGARRMQQVLLRQGHKVSRGKVRNLMKQMGITAIYQKPRTTIPNKAHKKYPFDLLLEPMVFGVSLLRDLEINRPNQVWCTDITYIPVERGYIPLREQGIFLFPQSGSLLKLSL